MYIDKVNNLLRTSLPTVASFFVDVEDLGMLGNQEIS